MQAGIGGGPQRRWADTSRVCWMLLCSKGSLVVLGQGGEAPLPFLFIPIRAGVCKLIFFFLTDSLLQQSKCRELLESQ